jgi:hypothetical protein
VSNRLIRVMRLAALPVLLATVVVAVSAAEATGGGAIPSNYVAAGLPTLDGDVNGLNPIGPWNISQGDSNVGPSLPFGNLFPTYNPTSAQTPGLNLAVFPAATAATPYPSGVAGTPGPLPGYCASGYPNDEGSTIVSQPDTDLPMSPYYFPDVVNNVDGSLTGYFDYRPKDADEAVVAANSTDHGKTWTVTGEALDQNQGYCPTADANDDGQGHPFVMSAGGSTNLYTLQRPAGDNTGIGLLVHQVNPSATDPLTGLAANESVGIDPNTFAESTVVVPTSGGTSIPVSTLGSANSPEDIVAGPYEVVAPGANSSSTFITCAGTNAGTTSLTGCTSTAPVTVASGEDLIEVIATANPGGSNTYTIPKGPNLPDGSGGLATVSITNATSVSPLTTYLLNDNAPNRLYIDGATVYCAQSNANPTTKIENCTTTQSSSLTVHQGDAITMDPIIPPTATMTSGLIAPDGIVGTLPTYPGAPSGSTVVLYTEKILSYFIEGTTTAKITLPVATIPYARSVTASEQPLPASGPFTVYLGTTTSAPIQVVTCTGSTLTSLTGCSGGSGAVASGNWVGGPNSAVVPYSVLSQTGEGNNGSSKGPEKLFGNNEDYTVLRAAYTTDGVNFTDLGAISGADGGTGNTSGSYDDISNPLQQASPSATNPTNLSPGAQDTDELRWVGSRGTIITNPDGSYGMFLSGAWATDGDSDAFNQIFYSSSTDGEHWTVPQVVLSTDYTFSASIAQQGTTNPLGISAYYSGRAYGPSVVQNPNGTLQMVFSGYRLPKPITSDGTVLGTNSSSLYTINPNDPALYRNILTMTLNPYLDIVGFWNQLSHGFPDFVGTSSVSNSSPVTVDVCVSGVTSCTNTNAVYVASTTQGGFSSGTNGSYPWTAGKINGGPINVPGSYVAQAYQSGAPASGLFAFTEGATDVSHVAITNGGTARTPDAGDSAAVVFTDPLNPATLCPSFSASAIGVQTLTGVTLALASSAFGDVLSVASPNCPGIGSVQTQMTEGPTGYVYVKGPGAATWSNSKISWDSITDTLTLTLGGTAGGSNGGIQTGVPPNFVTYNPAGCNNGLQDIARTPIPGCFNNTNSFTDPNKSGY